MSTENLSPEERACCRDWMRAGQSGSDNEGYGALIWDMADKGQPPDWRMGTCMGSVKFCPWCGEKK